MRDRAYVYRGGTLLFGSVCVGIAVSASVAGAGVGGAIAVARATTCVTADGASNAGAGA